MRRAILAAAFCFMVCATFALAAEDVSRVPPKLYADRLAPLLTPADEALKHRTDKGGGDDANVSLITESVRYVDDAGRSWIAVHQIDLARNDQGISQIARTVFRYRKSDQKVHLALARSIQPDGTSNTVASNAVLIQTPQDDQDASLYSDQAELVVVFPNVKANTACESIIVLEDTSPRIPGQFTAQLHFSSNWYHWRRRQVVEMSGAMAARLTITPLGAVPATPARAVLGDGTVRLTWEQDHAAPQQFEFDRAPEEQAGPIVYLTTLKDWNAVGSWYQTLLKGRDTAGKDLARQVADRTRGMTDRNAIVAALLTDAARDVRYTGLEFGTAGLQPYDPNEVWANRYGDCKDKANLLRTMLRARQIPADLALVNTEYAGRIEMRSPGVNQFDHMIVAVRNPDGGYVFCDPTIKYARPGLLRPDDIDRDVLVLKDNGAQFVHTPAQTIGNSRYDFDLKLATDGSLAGWMMVETDGYLASTQADYYSVNDRSIVRQRAQGRIQDFYPKAEVVDVDPMPIEKYADVYRLRAYFTVPAPDKVDGQSDGQMDGRRTLAFTGADTLLPDFGDQKTRQTDFWQSRRHPVVRHRIQLPAGWGATNLPRPFSVATDSVSASASWTADRGTVVADLDFRTLTNVVAPEKFTLLRNAVASLRSWIDKPLTVAAVPGGIGPNVAATAPASQPALADFPLMPTGEGQLDLLEKKFPADGDAKLRRHALEQVLQWFPDDRQTRFIASVRLLDLDQAAHPKDLKVLERMRQLLAGPKDGIDPDYETWAQYLLARWLTGVGQNAEALSIYTRLATDPAVNDYRRAWASYRGAQLEADSDPDKAIALLDGTLDVHSDALPYQFSEMALLVLKKKGHAADLQKRLDALAQRSPDDLDKVASSLVDDAKTYAAEDPPRTITGPLLDILDKLISRNSGLAHLREQVDAARQRIEGASAYATAAAAMKTYLAGYHPTWWDETPVDPSLKAREPFKAAVLRVYDNGTVNSFAKYTLEYLTRFSPDPADFGERTWRLVSSLQFRKREPKLMDELLAVLDQLPETDRWRWNGGLTRAQNLAEAGDPAAAIDLLHAMADNPKVYKAMHWATYRYCGEYLERLKRYDEALASYKKLESDLNAYSETCEGLLRAIFINLERDNRPEALRLCQLLSRDAGTNVEASPNAAQLRELVALARDPAAAERFWKRQATWWPIWLTIEHNASGPADDHPLVPLIPDTAALNRQLAAALESGDRGKFFQAYRPLIHAARWEPKFLIPWAAAADQAIQAAPQQQTQLRDLVVRAMTGLDVPDPEVMATAKIDLAVNLVDTNRSDEALAVVKAYLSTANQNDWRRQTMHRLWSYATTDATELGQAIDAMQADLEASEGVADRPRTVTRLADIYRQTGRRDLEVALLTRELNNPVIKADADNSRLLASRLQGMTKAAVIDDASAFSDGLNHWFATHKPAWYDFARPHALKDLGQQDAIALLKNPPKQMLPAEVAKLGFLIAQDASMPLENRVYAFDAAAWRMAELCRRHDDFSTLGASIFNDTHFPQKSRHYWIYTVLRDGANLPRTAMLRLHPLAASLTAAERQELDSTQLYGVDEDSDESLAQYLKDALASPLDPTRLAQFELAFSRLVQVNPEAARRAYADTQRLSLAPGNADGPAAVRLRMLRGLRFAESFEPANKAVARIVLSGFQSQPLDLPPDWAEHRDPKDLELLDPKDALAVRLWMIKTGRFAPNAFTFWADLLDDAPPPLIDLALRTHMFRAFMTLLPDDHSRSDVIFLFESFFDIDRPDHRQQLMSLIAPYRDPRQYPFSSGVIREVDATLALRDGKPIDLDEVLRDQKSALPQAGEVGDRLTAMLQSRDVAGIKRYLGQMSPDALVGPDDLPEKLTALQLAGMNDEADLVREAVREELYRDVLRSWSHPNRWDIRQSLKLAWLLDNAAQIPPRWTEDCTAQIQNPELLTDVRMRLAEIHHDWAGALAAAEQRIAGRPTRYDLFWDKGNALFRLGRNAQAAHALATFVEHCKNEVEYAGAVDMLAKARANP